MEVADDHKNFERRLSANEQISIECLERMKISDTLIDSYFVHSKDVKRFQKSADLVDIVMTELQSLRRETRDNNSWLNKLEGNSCNKIELQELKEIVSELGPVVRDKVPAILDTVKRANLSQDQVMKTLDELSNFREHSESQTKQLSSRLKQVENLYQDKTVSLQNDSTNIFDIEKRLTEYQSANQRELKRQVELSNTLAVRLSAAEGKIQVNNKLSSSDQSLNSDAIYNLRDRLEKLHKMEQYHSKKIIDLSAAVNQICNGEASSVNLENLVNKEYASNLNTMREEVMEIAKREIFPKREEVPQRNIIDNAIKSDSDVEVMKDTNQEEYNMDEKVAQHTDSVNNSWKGYLSKKKSSNINPYDKNDNDSSIDSKDRIDDWRTESDSDGASDFEDYERDNVVEVTQIESTTENDSGYVRHDNEDSTINTQNQSMVESSVGKLTLIEDSTEVSNSSSPDVKSVENPVFEESREVSNSTSPALKSVDDDEYMSKPYSNQNENNDNDNDNDNDLSSINTRDVDLNTSNTSVYSSGTGKSGRGGGNTATELIKERMKARLAKKKLEK